MPDMNQNDIRQLNLETLIYEAGSIVHLAETTGLTRGAIQHYRSGERNIGDNGARRLEEGMGKPEGWMSVSHIPEGHKIAAADVHRRLLKLPRMVTSVIADVLRLIENQEGESDKLGETSPLNPREGKPKERVITLKDNDAKKSERDSHVSKRSQR